jgi:predicted RNase H-like nuclease (RuvC/YqgF family)
MNASSCPHPTITPLRLIVQRRINIRTELKPNRGGPMTTWTDTATNLEQRLQKVERRLEELALHVKSLEHYPAELDQLREEIGKLKIEVEEMREE